MFSERVIGERVIGDKRCTMFGELLNCEGTSVTQLMTKWVILGDF